MGSFNTTIRQDGVHYNLTINVNDVVTKPQGVHSSNASSDWDYIGEPLELEYVSYNMDNKLVDIDVSDAILLREFELYCDTNDIRKG